MASGSLSKFAIGVVVEVSCVAVIGYFALSPEILNPNSSMFSFTIFGLTGVLLFNSLEYDLRKAFLIFPGVVALLFLISWFKNDTVVSTATNILWFVLIGALAFVAWKLLQPKNIRNSLFLPLIIWLATWIAVYLVMTFLDVFVFDSRRLAASVTSSWFFLRGIATGAILGLGTGVGFVITRMLVGERPNIQSS